MMIKRTKIYSICILLSILFSTNNTRAQLLRDSTLLNLIKENVDCIYNLEFKRKNNILPKINKLYPDHPAIFLLKGLQTYWMNYPMLETTPARNSFEKDLRLCIQLSEKNNNPTYEAEYLFYNLCARGMLLKFYDDNSLTKDVITLATSTYRCIIRSFRFSADCSDLLYYNGVYNYYREIYPKKYPVYKPLVILFPHGNAKEGIEEIQNSAINAVMLKAESYFLLAWIYLNFENNYVQAIKYSEHLYLVYPNNILYLVTYIKNLLLVKKYNEAEKLITPHIIESENKYLQAQLNIFRGIILEKKYHNYNQAQHYYNSGLCKISTYGKYGNEYAAYAYFGLSRIYSMKGETNHGQYFHEKAIKLAAFKNITFDK